MGRRHHVMAGVGDEVLRTAGGRLRLQRSRDLRCAINDEQQGEQRQCARDARTGTSAGLHGWRATRADGGTPHPTAFEGATVVRSLLLPEPESARSGERVNSRALRFRR